MAVSKYERALKRDIPFAEKLKIIMRDKTDAISQIALSHFAESALADETLIRIFGAVAQEKAMAFYRSFIETGKKESVIDENIPTEAVMFYFMNSMSIFERPEFAAANSDYKIGLMKLFLYGLIGGKA
jgi:hypothetical protein